MTCLTANRVDVPLSATAFDLIKQEVDLHLKRLDEQFPALQKRVREAYALLDQKLDEAREREPLTHA